MRAVRRVEQGDQTQFLDKLADKVVQLGLAGEASAYKEIGDRLDGKAPQAIEQSGTIEHLYVARVPMPSKTGDEWQRDHASNLDRQTLQ